MIYYRHKDVIYTVIDGDHVPDKKKSINAAKRASRELAKKGGKYLELSAQKV
jgi:hypothetical protein